MKKDGIVSRLLTFGFCSWLEPSSVTNTSVLAAPPSRPRVQVSSLHSENILAAQLLENMPKMRLRKFPCSQCEHVAVRRGHLKIHEATVHNGEKHFRCPECPRAFGQKSHLNRHIRGMHTPGNVRHRVLIAVFDLLARAATCFLT